MKRETLLTAVGLMSLVASAKVEFKSPFTDGMVLQRDKPVQIWGKADPEEEVEVEFADQEVETTADKDGNWSVTLEPMEASCEGRTLTANDAEIKDVLVGEVWLASGQSNMDCPIWRRHPRYRQGTGAMMLQMTKKPCVRYLWIPAQWNREAQQDFVKQPTGWRKFTPELLDLYKRESLVSAVGYFYALELHHALGIPVAIIDSSWGGSPVDGWTPRSGYANHPALKDIAELPLFKTDKEWMESHTNGIYKIKGFFAHAFWQPTAIWNGMINPIKNYALRGAIWYQGCANSGEPQRYREKMHALYDGWKKEFNNENLPFYFVQLAPWGRKTIAETWLAQAQFDADEPNVGMAVINDLGNLNDIHPNNKETVAKRLALFALKRDYGWDWVKAESPTLKSWKIENGQFVLSFNHAESWYVYNPDRSLTVGFEVVGTNGVWHAAKIVNFKKTKDRWDIESGNIEGKDLVVASDEVKEPVKLRYLFSAPWFGALYNEVNLPVGAFEIK